MSDEKVLLNDDDLDQVVGGTIVQSIRDFSSLQKMGAISQDADFDCETMRKTFAKYGVTVDDHGGFTKDNKYFIDNKEVTGQQALDYVSKKLK